MMTNIQAHYQLAVNPRGTTQDVKTLKEKMGGVKKDYEGLEAKYSRETWWERLLGKNGRLRGRELYPSEEGTGDPEEGNELSLALLQKQE